MTTLQFNRNRMLGILARLPQELGELFTSMLGPEGTPSRRPHWASVSTA
ncbi:MAG: hypothetical protein E5299_00936 [Burkholderia gladioli]|nr:MAG: hypothetical protein E5299_00936 [Burkholderia gladioli]